MMWEEQVYVDAALPFSLRSAPKIFTALVNAIGWIAKSPGAKHCDTIWMISLSLGTRLRACHLDLESLIAIRQHLGVPLALEKVEGPTVRLFFFGYGLTPLQES